MSREAVFVKEPKKKIEKIKNKYNNYEMSDSTARKIATLEITGNVLKLATVASGVITAVDLLIPDPVLGLDEAGLAAITGLLTYSTTLVDKKINDLANVGNTTFEGEEAQKLASQIGNVAGKISPKNKSK